MMYLENTADSIRTALPLDVAAENHPADFILTLLSISKSTRALSALMLCEIGLHVGQDQLLAALDINKPISVSAVSAVLNVRPSTVSKMTDRLVAKGLIERGLDKGDARRTVLRLTTAGAAKLVDVQALWQKLSRVTCSDATFDEGEMASCLHAVDAILKKRLARLR